MRTLSRQTFPTTYYLKRRALQAQIAAGIVAGSANRQIARSLGCTPTTVARQAARLGRHAMLLQVRALGALEGKDDETFVFDHFVTFDFTQDYPFGIGTAVGRESWFVYDVDPAPHARAGRTSAAQKARIAGRPKRDTRGGYLQSTLRTLDVLAQVVGPDRRLHVDGRDRLRYGLPGAVLRGLCAGLPALIFLFIPGTT